MNTSDRSTDHAPAPSAERGPVAREIDELEAFIRHRLWRARPTVRLEVDAARDVLVAAAVPELPDLEIEHGPELFAGFSRYSDEYLLTSLSLQGVSCWDRTDQAGIAAARGLLGPRMGDQVAGLARGGEATVVLRQKETEALVGSWRRFVADHEPGGRQAWAAGL